MFEVVVQAILLWALINLSIIPVIIHYYIAELRRRGIIERINERLTVYQMKVWEAVPLVQLLAPYTLGRFSNLAWSVFFAPFFEEVIFFGIPLCFGYNYAVLGLLAWVIVHVARFEYAYQVFEGFDYYLALALITLHFTLHGLLSLYLWSLGYGLLSIALHSLTNAFITFSASHELKKIIRRRRRGERGRFWSEYSKSKKFWR